MRSDVQPLEVLHGADDLGHDTVLYGQLRRGVGEAKGGGWGRQKVSDENAALNLGRMMGCCCNFHLQRQTWVIAQRSKDTNGRRIEFWQWSKSIYKSKRDLAVIARGK